MLNAPSKIGSGNVSHECRSTTAIEVLFNLQNTVIDFEQKERSERKTNELFSFLTTGRDPELESFSAFCV